MNERNNACKVGAHYYWCIVKSHE